MAATSIVFDASAFSAQALSSARSLAAVLDHTLLKADATRTQVEKICAEAAEYRFACAMINPFWTEVAISALKGTGVPVGVVVGFPLGASLPSSKLDEADRVTKIGAHDVDMVLNIGALKSEDFKTVKIEIAQIASLVHDRGAILKVILETCLLTFEEKLRASEIAISAGADFIKTSTGFSTGGATADDIQLMRGVAGTRAGVKASGGIRTLEDARAMLAAGATRIGASASVRIVHELSGKTDANSTQATGY
ncbi:deoxyribose-phosphate aldolase [Terriglobus saanensis]|uniref:Deoxyribose-phosphate aldolase n=1 Tax=Terriglobus saanensis (strain ATCC BAA-1853 / DSM 23119 / SP1PR4) TaxID=401053 RepID=E8V5S6_TERSS|nr:deoxyribose-phosphate aldolase [Terriglobus saanensis]ADV82685.1 deoxyribose-phosphate aldolase [Terriglobus saanensis SP1PR4]